VKEADILMHERNEKEVDSYCVAVWEKIFLMPEIYIDLNTRNFNVEYFPDDNKEFMETLGIINWACPFGPNSYVLDLELEGGLFSKLLNTQIYDMTMTLMGDSYPTASPPNTCMILSDRFSVYSEFDSDIVDKGRKAYERLGNITWYCTDDWDKLSLAELSSVLIKLNNYSDEDFDLAFSQVLLGDHSIQESLHVFK